MTTAKRLFSGTDIACIRGNRLLFQNLSFSLSPGEALHLAGANGAGKSSLLRILAGALPAAAGEILWRDENFLENGREDHGARFCFLPPDDKSLKPLETAEENLRFWAAYSGAGDACGAALEKIGIVHLKDIPVRRLSAGQKRRLSLARVFLKDTPLWLLDEPLNGLDAAAQGLFLQALKDHRDSGGIAVIASHHAIDAKLKRVEVGAA